MSELDEKGVKKIVDAAVAPLAAANDKLTEDNKTLTAELKASKEKGEERDKAERTGKIETARRTVKGLLDAAVKDEGMTPAVREGYAKQIGGDDDDRVLDIDVEQVKLMCGSVKSTDDDQQGKDSKGDKLIDDKDPAGSVVSAGILSFP